MSERKAVVLIVASSLALGLVLTAALMANTPWTRDAWGILAAWLLLASAPILHELGHRTVFRKHGVRAEIVASARTLLSFGGSVKVPENVHPAVMLRGVLAGPFTTMAMAITALAFSPLVPPLSLVATVLSAAVAGAGAPLSSDGRHMPLKWRITFIVVGALLFVASAYTAAYLIKHG